MRTKNTERTGYLRDRIFVPLLRCKPLPCTRAYSPKSGASTPSPCRPSSVALTHFRVVHNFGKRKRPGCAVVNTGMRSLILQIWGVRVNNFLQDPLFVSTRSPVKYHCLAAYQGHQPAIVITQGLGPNSVAV